MAPRPSSLLTLALCLGQMIHMLEGVWPTPTIWAEPGSTVARGSSVTLVCRSSAGFDTFRLEKEENNDFRDKRNVQTAVTEARFLISVVNDTTGGLYRCRYLKDSQWSDLSRGLKLVVSGGTVTRATTTVLTRLSGPRVTQPLVDDIDNGVSDGDTRAQALGKPGLQKKYLYIIIAVSVFLFLILLLLLFCLRRQCQSKGGLPRVKAQVPKPQDRFSLAANSVEWTSGDDLADEFPEDGESYASIPATWDSEDVTYAQVDYGALTPRASQMLSTQLVEPTDESNNYAVIARD